MQAQMPSWEQTLISLAYEARHSIGRAPGHLAATGQLARAYRYCEALTAQHSKSFYLASQLLPWEKRRAVRALYAFCRVTDDIVDCDAECENDGEVDGTNDQRGARLRVW